MGAKAAECCLQRAAYVSFTQATHEFDKLLLNLNKTNVIWRWSSLVCCFSFFGLLLNVVYLLITEIINGIMLIVINRCLIWIAGLGVQLCCCMLDSIISFKCLNNPDCCWSVQSLKWDTALVVTVVTFANRILPETSKIEPSKNVHAQSSVVSFPDLGLLNLWVVVPHFQRVHSKTLKEWL